MFEFWKNIFAVLSGTKMTKENLIKITAYLVDPSDIGPYRDTKG